MDAKALDAARKAVDEGKRAEIDALLSDAKIDLNEYFLSGSAEEFRELMAQAPRPFEWQIKQLNPDEPDLMRRNEALRPVLETLAELDALDRNAGIALIQRRYGGAKKLPRKVLDAGIADASKRRKPADARPRPSSLPPLDETTYVWKKSLLALRGNRIVEIRDATGPDGESFQVETVIANFRLQIERERVIDTGDGEATRKLTGAVHVDGKGRFPFEISAEDFYTSLQLAKKIGAVTGPQLEFDSADIERIRNFCVHVSEFSTATIVQCFGPHPKYGFVSPAVSIKDGVISPNDSEEFRCDLAPLRNKSVQLLDLAAMPAEQLPTVGEHIVGALFALTPPHVSRCLLGHTFLAPIYHRLRTRYNPYVLFCSGVTGTGKTSVAQLYQNFFGDFAKKGTLVSWGSTPKTVEKAGHHFNGALFVSDDFKKANIGYHWNDAKRILQGYTDGHDRGRLKQNAEFKASEMIRGMLLVTGEDLPEGEASNLARIIEVSFNGARYGPELRDRYTACLKKQHLYRGLMAHYVAWTQRVSDEQLLDIVASYYSRLDASLGSAQIENRPRILQNFALMLTGLNLALSFFEDHGVVTAVEAEAHVSEHLNWAAGAMLDTAEAVRNERTSVIFIDVLSSLIATGRLTIGQLLPTGAGRYSYRSDRPLSTAVGYLAGDDVYILRDVAMKEVSEFLSRGGRSLNHSAKGISAQLLADGLIVPNEKDVQSRAVWRLRINGKRVACYKMAAGVFGEDVLESSMGSSEEDF